MVQHNTINHQTLVYSHLFLSSIEFQHPRCTSDNLTHGVTEDVVTHALLEIFRMQISHGITCVLPKEINVVSAGLLVWKHIIESLSNQHPDFCGLYVSMFFMFGIRPNIICINQFTIHTRVLFKDSHFTQSPSTKIRRV